MANSMSTIVNGAPIVNGRMPTSGEAQLLALADLIRTTVTDVIEEHKKANIPVPSLDAAGTFVPGFDRIEQTTPKLRHAIRTVQGACGQLSASVTNPKQLVFTKGLGFAESACLQLVLFAKVPDLLDGHTEGLHVKELAAKSSIPADNLERALRLLSTGHVFIETEPGVFVNNRASLQLRSDEPTCSMVKVLVDLAFKAGPALSETFSDRSIHAVSSPFERVYGLKFFEYLGQTEELTKLFAMAMRGLGDISGRGMLAEVYPWDSLPTTTTFSICDVGGGTGHIPMTVLKAFPEHKFRAVIQDAPSMLEEGVKLWADQFPEAVEEGRVEFVPINFIKEAPVAGCDFYYLRFILHDWPDAQCLDILRNVVKAMRAKRSSRFLLHDFVLRRPTPAGAHSTGAPLIKGLDVAPPPLLANYGTASSIGFNMDLNMMATFASKDRTLDEVLSLTSQVGLTFERFWDAGLIDILEFSLNDRNE